MNIDAYRFWSGKLYPVWRLICCAQELVNKYIISVYRSTSLESGHVVNMPCSSPLLIFLLQWGLYFLTQPQLSLIHFMYISEEDSTLRMYLLTTVDFSERYQKLFDNEFWKLFWITIFHTPTFIEIKNYISIKKIESKKLRTK